MKGTLSQRSALEQQTRKNMKLIAMQNSQGPSQRRSQLLTHNRFLTAHRFLDKAAIEDEGDKLNGSSAVSPWRLCTVHQIEEFKSLLRMAPIWATTILVSTVIVQQGTFSVQQGRSMDRCGPNRVHKYSESLQFCFLASEGVKNMQK